MRDTKAVAGEGGEDLRLPSEFRLAEVPSLEHDFTNAPRRSLTAFEWNGRPGAPERCANGRRWRCAAITET
jgi:hypothetical protein